jgi:hypothetical protein
MFLLHAEAGVAQLVLLIGQVGFALQDADVQERVAETEDHIARPYLRPFLNQAFFDTPAFDSVEIDDTVRQHLPDNPDIVVELSFLHGSDRNAFFLHFQGRGSITKKKPKQAKQSGGGSCYGVDLFLLKPGFPLDAGVHVIDCHSCCIYSVTKKCSCAVEVHRAAFQLILQTGTRQLCLGQDVEVPLLHQFEDGDHPLFPFLLALFQRGGGSTELFDRLPVFLGGSPEGEAGIVYFFIKAEALLFVLVPYPLQAETFLPDTRQTGKSAEER